MDKPRLTYRPELDGIRGLAIAGVLAAHVHLSLINGAASLGVTLFFVLSGYLITSLLMAERATTGRVSLRGFYERRIRRLLPALLAVIAASGVAAVILGLWPQYPAQALLAVLYIGNMARSSGFDMGLLSHTWSLSLEEQFYLFWPALFIVLSRRSLVRVAILGIAWVILVQVTLWTNPDTGYRSDVRGDALLWGCLVALLGTRLPRWTVALAWLGAFALCFNTGAPYQFSAESLVSVGIVLGAAYTPWLRFGPLVRLGQISYGVYLWHLLPLWFLTPAILGGSIPAMVVALILAIVLALTSERWIERPFRRRRSAAPSSLLEPAAA